MTKDFIGERLRLARVFLGISLQELGHTVSTSRQYVQQLENGSKNPNQEMVFALAEALKVDPDFFVISNVSLVAEEKCHFRSLKTAAVKVRLQALAHGTMFDKLAQQLDDLLELPAINFPKIDGIECAEDIERAAERCRIEWNLNITSPITNMFRVLENAGALITYFTEISEKIDAFSLQKHRPLIIRNPYKKSTCRMRFDLAHECGHIVMHEGIETGDNKTEAEANRFASAFLLPRAAFIKEFPDHCQPHFSKRDWLEIEKLKQRWKVSIAAIIRRAYDLALIDAISYRNANIYLRRTGQSKEERGDESIPKERPEVIKHAFEALKSEDKQDLFTVLDNLKIRPEFFKKLLGDIEFSVDDFKPIYRSTNVIELRR